MAARSDPLFNLREFLAQSGSGKTILTFPLKQTLNSQGGCGGCGGLQMLDRFYGLESDGSVWMNDGVRCLNCGSINAPMREAREPVPSLRTERANQYGLTVRTVASR